jgi:sugar lactone lactonase YvrE
LNRLTNRIAIANALMVGALLSAGCPNGATPGATIKTVNVPKSDRGNQPGTGANPGASKTPAPTLPGQDPGPTPTLPTLPVATPPVELPPLLPGVAFLGGSVTAPSIISNAGGSIISNNGSAIISNNGSGIISNNGGAIISNAGGSIISNNGGAYRIQDASGDERTLTNVFLYLTDRDERFFRNNNNSSIFTATTDAAGNYRFDVAANSGFPLNKDVVVNALINGNLRMTGYMVPIDGENQLKLNLATTVTTEFLRGEAYRSGKSLRAFDKALFYQTVAQTQQAITTGDIEAVKTVTNGTATRQVGVFDLRLDHVFNLRNQYAVAISALDKAKTSVSRMAAVKAISDNWKSLFGYRPTAVTTLIGNGQTAKVNPAWTPSYSAAIGGMTGDHRLTTTDLAGPQIPMGYTYGVANAKRGDVFIAGFSEDRNSGYIRWIKPNGTISSIWLPSFNIVAPVGICVESEPTDPPNVPGKLLVVDNYLHQVVRVPIVDEPWTYVDGDGYIYEEHMMELVAGESTHVFSESWNPDHPNLVDVKRDPVTKAPLDSNGAPIANYDHYEHHRMKVPLVPYSPAAPESSRWRLWDEGERVYREGNAADASTPYPDAVSTGVIHLAGTPVTNPARYAHLNSPQDVEIDDLGNIYIADRGNHRVRMIPKVAGNYFGYRAPVDANNDGLPDRDGSGKMILGAAVTMQPGCIYTIAGDPKWDTTRTTDLGGYWVGEYLDSDNTAGGSAQSAHLDQPYSLAWDNTKKVLYVSDFDNQRVRAIARGSDGPTGMAAGAIWTAAGKPLGGQRGTTDRDYAPADLTGGQTGGDGGQANQAQLSFPRGIAVDGQGRLYINDERSGRIRMVNTDGVISTIAGRPHNPVNPPLTDNIDDGDAINYADLWDLEFIDVDKDGNVIFSDLRHRRARKLWRQWE